MVSIVQAKVYLSCQEFICILIFECNLQFDEYSKISNTHYKITKMHHKIIKKLYFTSHICSFSTWSFTTTFLPRDKENMENRKGRNMLHLLPMKKYIKDKIFTIVKWSNRKASECKWYKVSCRKILRYTIMNIKT